MVGWRRAVIVVSVIQAAIGFALVLLGAGHPVAALNGLLLLVPGAAGLIAVLTDRLRPLAIGTNAVLALMAGQWIPPTLLSLLFDGAARGHMALAFTMFGATTAACVVSIVGLVKAGGPTTPAG